VKVIDRDAFEKLAGYANQDTLPGGADSART